jgi:hypothetical protein
MVHRDLHHRREARGRPRGKLVAHPAGRSGLESPDAGLRAGYGEDEDLDRTQGGETLISWNNAQGGDTYNPSLRISLL